MSLRSHISKMDWPLIFSSLAVTVIGIVAIYSTCLRGGDFSNLYKQIAFFIVSLACMFGVSLVDNRAIRENPVILLSLYLLCVLSLLGIFFFAPEIRGIRAWYKIGIFSFDPAEPTKIVLILVLAKYFSKRHVELYKMSHIIFSGLYALVPAALIFFRPEFGSVIIIFAIWAGMLLVSGIRMKEFLILAFTAVAVFFCLWAFLFQPYQKDRILSFVMPQNDELGSGWNKNQAEISIGSGGLWGQGVGHGTQTQYGFLPEPQTDFIFSVIGEEAGLIGVTVLLSLLVFMLWRILKIGLNARSNFSRLFAIGLAISLFAQIIINIGMNCGLLPVVGIPLPLVSYGGSNLIFTFIALGLLQNIKITES